MVKKIMLARHCSTGEEYRGRFVGRTDLPLGPEAASEVERLAGVLAPLAPAATLFSPLRRARRTAEMLAGLADIGSLREDLDLREIDFGRWEGKSFAELAPGDSELVKRWAAWAPDFAFPEGEAVAGFLARVGAVAARLAARPEERLLVVAHGGVIRALICHLLGIPPRNYLLFDVRPARLATVDLFPEGGVLTGLNL